MFIRALFKQQARKALSGQYGTCMLVTAIFAVIPLALELAENHLAASILALVVMGPLYLALLRYFYRVSRGKRPELGDFFGGLTHFGNAALAFLWQSLWIALWLLLLVVPGVVKWLSYSQQLFLLAEYPSLTPRNSLTLSKKLTEGYKWELFVTNCSFLGWLLLSLVTCGLALLYVIPYYCTTMAVIYRFLKEKALADGRLSAEERALLQKRRRPAKPAPPDAAATGEASAAPEAVPAEAPEPAALTAEASTETAPPLETPADETAETNCADAPDPACDTSAPISLTKEASPHEQQ